MNISSFPKYNRASKKMQLLSLRYLHATFNFFQGTIKKNRLSRFQRCFSCCCSFRYFLRYLSLNKRLPLHVDQLSFIFILCKDFQVFCSRQILSKIFLIYCAFFIFSARLSCFPYLHKQKNYLGKF